MTPVEPLKPNCVSGQASLNADAVENALLLRIAHQDRAALAEFYERFHRRLFGYLFRMTGSHSLAEDVLQDVMLVIWRNASSYHGASKASSWVFGIAHNLALTALRLDRAGNQVEWGEVAEVESDDLPLEDDVMRRVTTETLLRALAQLTPEHRAVLELTFYQDFSCKEIALITDVPEGTVKSRLSYARRTLKALLLNEQEVI